MKSDELATNSLRTTVAGLERIRMSPEERRSSRALVRQAELIAAVLLRANTGLRHAFGFIARVSGALARPGATPRLQSR